MPRMWFAHFELIMAPQKQGDNVKFEMAVAKLNKEALRQVSDLIQSPPATEKYNALKRRLIAVYEESAETQFQKLVSEMDLGTQKPSQLLRRMTELAKNVGISVEPLKKLWINRLPPNVRAVLAVSGDTRLEDLAAIADKILENLRSGEIASVSSAQAEVHPDIIRHMRDLTAEINKLKLEINSIRTRGRSPNRRQEGQRWQRSNSHRRQNASLSRRTPESPDWLCREHYRFRERARTCTSPFGCPVEYLHKDELLHELSIRHLPAETTSSTDDLRKLLRHTSKLTRRGSVKAMDNFTIDQSSEVAICTPKVAEIEASIGCPVEYLHKDELLHELSIRHLPAETTSSTDDLRKLLRHTSKLTRRGSVKAMDNFTIDQSSEVAICTPKVAEVEASSKDLTSSERMVKRKIEKLFKEWQNLKKNKENKKKRSEALKRKEQNWQQKLEDLFDIAHRDALNIMTLEEDKQFLLAVRQNRRQFLIGSVDRKSLNKCKKIKEKKERLDKLRERENKDISSITEKCSLSSLSFISSSSATTSGEVTPSDPEFISKLTKMQPPQKRARKDIINSQLASSLDVSKLSDRKATMVVTSTLKSAGCDPSEFNVNRSSIRRQRVKNRKAVAESLKSEFKPSSSLTIHWDGKLIEDITGHKTVDRLPILVSGHGVDQLLAVPKLERGTSEACASAVYDAINSWNLSDKVKCLCFDTTAVNTGLRSGVCVLLERKMDKNMLWFACRHHIMEIMLSGVVDQSLAPSSGPDIQLFKRFKNSWDSIDQSDFKTITDDAEANILAEVAADRISFAKKQLQVHQPRDDYKEMLNLTIIFLGGVPEKGYETSSYEKDGKMKTVRKSVKKEIKIPIRKLVQQLEETMPLVCKHVATITHQYQMIAKLKRKLTQNEVLIHIDFSENYCCKYYEEIQAVHFGGARQQVTLHTGVLWVHQMV
ncbi:unnamed protein product [Chilo suppressalis]|uniref:DUF7041 domain-containing protein n=1 Tax=Chilo suppressalis TaxID=168631 RepID=A0ABN8AP85_CHISP|nr:unnamed protein product [Chilo suppressalis]